MMVVFGTLARTPTPVVPTPTPTVPRGVLTARGARNPAPPRALSSLMPLSTSRADAEVDGARNAIVDTNTVAAVIAIRMGMPPLAIVMRRAA
jgi:hypothetical protein